MTNEGFNKGKNYLRKAIVEKVEPEYVALPDGSCVLDTQDEPEPFGRGVCAFPYSSLVLFLKEIEIKVNESPTWKPCIVIDSYRIED